MEKLVVKQVKKSVIMHLEQWISNVDWSVWIGAELEGQVEFYQWEEEAE